LVSSRGGYFLQKEMAGVGLGRADGMIGLRVPVRFHIPP